MKEVIIKNKGKYLKDHYPFYGVPKLSEKRICIHCDQIFTVRDYKVFRFPGGNDLICCPNTPRCNGTVIDWMSV
jgi:hypothetical protein